MSATQNPPKRPRLSLQIKAISSGPNLRASRTIAAAVDPTSPTSFNTLSNVYATAVDRATPITAINTKQPLRLDTQNLAHAQHGHYQTPFICTTYPETPLTAQPISPAVAAVQQQQQQHDMLFPSSMTATPPMSAGAVDGNEARPFSFSAADATSPSSCTPTAPAGARQEPEAPSQMPAWAINPSPSGTMMRRRATVPVNIHRAAATAPPPYVRNLSLHSILRNSPLPPPTARTPVSPRRQSQRLAEKAARRVGYESPIERVITTQMEFVPSPLGDDDGSGGGNSYHNNNNTTGEISPLTSSYSEARDGGQTPGPLEEMRRRMVGLGTRTPTSPVGSGGAGVRKRRRRERKRQWVWTINGEDEGDDAEVGGAIAATRAAARAQDRDAARWTWGQCRQEKEEGSDCPMVLCPGEVLTPSVEVCGESEDVGMSGSDEVAAWEEGNRSTINSRSSRWSSLAPGDLNTDVDMVTPTEVRKGRSLEAPATRLESEGLVFNSETGSRRDTPI